jgi:hypothetical protein
MTRIGLVTVPYFVSDYHRTLADATLSSVCSSHSIDRIAIVNRTRNDGDESWLKENFDYFEHNDTNILARAWNIGIKRALDRGASHVIVANLDIIFHPWCIDNLFECAQQNPHELVWSTLMWHELETLSQARITATCRPGINWSCFMVDKRLFETVGDFDEKFVPAYREDYDMLQRLRLVGHSGTVCHAAVVATSERGTIKGILACDSKDIPQCSNLLHELRHCITRNDERYMRKWGVEQGVERFTVPFNGSPDPASGQ